MFSIAARKLKAVLLRQVSAYHAMSVANRHRLYTATMAATMLCCSAIGYYFGLNANPAVAAGSSLTPLASSTVEAVQVDAVVLARYKPEDEETAVDVLSGTVVRSLPAHNLSAQQQHLLVLERKLGQLRARLADLGAVGNKLVHLADMQDGEFDFQPCTGRPAVVSGGFSSPILPLQAHLGHEIALLFPQLDHMNTQLQALQGIFTQRRSVFQSWPSGVPVYAAKSDQISSRYGYRVLPGAKQQRFHRGLDIAAASGSPVLAMANGIVTFSADSGNYGNLIEIDHGNGYKTRYGHNRENLVTIGNMVRKGQMIATVGTTGRSTGPHVHVEVLERGASVNPQLFLDLQ